MIPKGHYLISIVANRWMSKSGRTFRTAPASFFLLAAHSTIVWCLKTRKRKSKDENGVEGVSGAFIGRIRLPRGEILLEYWIVRCLLEASLLNPSIMHQSSPFSTQWMSPLVCLRMQCLVYASSVFRVPSFSNSVAECIDTLF